jgi:lysophospholipase L1-like esterase
MGSSEGSAANGLLVFAFAAVALMAAQCTPPTSGAGEAAGAPLPVPELLRPDRAGQRPLEGATALAPFFAALDRVEHKHPAEPLRIIQIGDSHTAADGFTGYMRELLQQRFGAVGRGWLPAGIPFKYYDPRLVAVAETNWRHLGPAAAEGLPLGLDAVLAESQGRDARMTLASTEPAGFDRLAIEFLAEPGGAPLSVRIDDRPPLRVPTAAPSMRAKCAAIPLRGAAHRIELAATGKQPVRLIGWSTERRGAGILYENHGTIGARIGLLAQMNSDTVGYELADRRPALLVVAFGTNEGFDDTLDLEQYAARFRDAVDMLRRHAPSAAILVVGPPDGNRLDPSCPRDGASCADDQATPCAWHVPPNLRAVREIQRRVATVRGWAFWDWSAAMGGACSMHGLAARDPPWAFPDHVHLTRLGANASAEVLYFDLMAAYRRWQVSRPRGPRVATTE